MKLHFCFALADKRIPQNCFWFLHLFIIIIIIIIIIIFVTYPI